MASHPQKLESGGSSIRLLCRMAGDHDVTGRLGAANLASSFSRSSPDLVSRLLSRLLGDHAGAVRAAAHRGFVQFLHALQGVSRLNVLMEWTHSRNRGKRKAVAAALSHHGGMVGCAGAVIALAQDPCRTVRFEAAQSAATLFESNPLRYRRVLEVLSQDHCRSVRLVARERLARRVE